MIKFSIFIASIFFLLSFTGCSSDIKEKKTIDKTKEINSLVSKNQYILKSTDSKEYIVTKEGDGFVLKGAKGKIVIFDIFATWCPPCRATATHLTSLQNKFKDKIVVIGISIEDNITNTKLEDFAQKNNAHYTLVNSKANRSLADAIVMELGLGDRYPIPTMAMYLDGVLVNHYVGMAEEEFIESDIKRALGI